MAQSYQAQPVNATISHQISIRTSAVEPHRQANKDQPEIEMAKLGDELLRRQKSRPDDQRDDQPDHCGSDHDTPRPPPLSGAGCWRWL